MNPDLKAMRSSLQKKELELQRLMRQMQFDKLNNSTVYRNLESELHQVKQQQQLEQLGSSGEVPR